MGERRLGGVMGEQEPNKSEIPPSGERQQLNGEREYEAAIDRVVEAAQNRLHIFDVDFTRGGYNSVGRYELLQDFLRRGRGNALVVVLHDTTYFTAYCPRLMNLLRLHSHAVSVYQTTDKARVANDPFVIADEVHYVHRLHRDHPRSILALNDPNEARAIEGRFQEILEASYPAIFATTLGL
jgi:hypothetical protein